MEILTEFDGLQEALKKVKMDESVMPYVNGRLVDDSAWNKTQKILNCPEMISAHKYLYNLDMDQLTEEEIDKINQLYKVGCDRGFIIDDLTDWNAPDAPTQATDAPEQTEETPKTEEPIDQKPVSGSLFKAKVPCWTIIYSATSKDGDIKTGEAYSNAISASAAKADVNAKLSRIGYSNISILAIEATDACDASAAQTCVKEVEDVAEDDMLDGRPHNNHVSEADEEDESKDDAESDESDEEESKEDAEEKEDSENSEDSEDNASDDSFDSNDESKDDDGTEEEEEEEDTEEDSEDSEESEDSEDGEKELDANEKAELKDKYRKTFKNVLSKCKFESSFNDLTLEQKVKFFTELSKAWNKNEPTEFMTDKEVEQLNNVVVKEGSDD